jgi:hypothetical protein
VTRIALAAACAVALAACATPTPPRQVAQDLRRALDARAPVAVERIAFDPLKVGEAAVVRLDDTSAVLSLDGRQTYARGFVLPGVDGRVRLAVRSTAVGGGVFYPEVRWLDAQFRAVGRIESDRYALRGLGGTVNTLSADAFLDPTASSARYLLVTERAIAEAEEHVVQPTSTGAVPLMVPIGTMMFVWMIPTGSTAGPAQVVASPVGTLEILVEPARLRTIDRPAAAPEAIR